MTWRASGTRPETTYGPFVVTLTDIWSGGPEVGGPEFGGTVDSLIVDIQSRRELGGREDERSRVHPPRTLVGRSWRLRRPNGLSSAGLGSERTGWIDGFEELTEKVADDGHFFGRH